MNPTKEKVIGLVLAVSVLALAIPTAAYARTTAIEVVGTLLPPETKYGSEVYTLEAGDQKWHLGVAQFKPSSPFDEESHYTYGYGLRRAGTKLWRLTGEEEKMELLNVFKACEKVRIRGYFSDWSGRLRILSVEPVNRDIKLRWCEL